MRPQWSRRRPACCRIRGAVFVATLGGGSLPATEVLAVVLAYRAACYLLPLAPALPAYAWSEAAARRGRWPG